MSTDKEKRGLRGRVASVKTETTELTRKDNQFSEKPWLVETLAFDEEGQLLETTFHNSEHPDYSSKQTFSYDTTGKLIEQSFYYLNGKPGGKTVYIYDHEDKFVEESTFDVDGECIGKRESVYHANGEKAEETFFDYRKHEPNTSYDYGIDANPEYDHSFTADDAHLIKTLYDLKGNPTELLFLNESGKVLSKVVFTTDADGRIIKDAQYAGEEFRFGIPEGTEVPAEIVRLFSGKFALSESELAYDSEGRKVEDRMQFGGIHSIRRIFKYDAKGKLIEDATYEGDGTLQSSARIEREYDNNDNWIKKLVSSWNKKDGVFEPSVVYRRTITYYG